MSSSLMIRTSMYLSALVGAVLSTYFFIFFLLTPGQCLIVHDYRMHDNVRARIGETVRKTLQSTSCSLEKLSSAITKNAPLACITHVSLKPIRKALIRYALPSAVALITCNNQHYVLNQKGQVVDKNVYNPTHLDNLIVIHCLDQHQISGTQLKNFLDNLPLEFLHYTITWHNKTHIFLETEQEKKYKILAAADTLITFQELQKIKQILQNKKNKTHIIDLRFKNHIVLKDRREA